MKCENSCEQISLALGLGGFGLDKSVKTYLSLTVSRSQTGYKRIDVVRMIRLGVLTCRWSKVGVWFKVEVVLEGR